MSNYRASAFKRIKYAILARAEYMSNWDLMMPGMGLTSIGLAGVTVSYAGIAHTFIDGMHALTGLTMFIGLIFLAAGILEGGVSTSNRAKATALVVTAISLSFGTFALVYNTVSTIPLFAGILIAIAFPAIMLAYIVTKMPMYAKPVGAIFALAAAAGIVTFVAFGFVAPGAEQAEEPALTDEPAEEIPSDAPVVVISMLEGSAVPDAPDYDPDPVTVDLGSIIEWVNDDIVVHTATSDADFGETFDSGLLTAGETFRVDTGALGEGQYDYVCIVHPWMQGSFTVAAPQ